MENKNKGKLICVGAGIKLGAHMTNSTGKIIQKADIVYTLMADALHEEYIASLNKNVVSLQQYYGIDKSRRVSYREMIEVVVTSVKKGLNVCLCLYGHPGVFAKIGHSAIKQATDLGFYARMEPAISADACLFSDLGIDPGKAGSVQYEATQFLIYDKRVDLSSYLLLWQIAVVGDLTYKNIVSDQELQCLFLKKLLRYYPEDHEVIIYEAESIPTFVGKIAKISLKDYLNVELSFKSTLIIPPLSRPKRDKLLDNNIEDINICS